MRRMPAAVRGGPEVAGGRPIVLLEPVRHAHAVHEVVGDIAPLHGLRQARRIEHVGKHGLRVAVVLGLELFGTAREAAHAVATLFEAGEQAATHVAGGPGEEDQGPVGRWGRGFGVGSRTHRGIPQPRGEEERRGRAMVAYHQGSRQRGGVGQVISTVEVRTRTWPGTVVLLAIR